MGKTDTEKAQDARRFQEQCFLIDNYDIFANPTGTAQTSGEFFTSYTYPNFVKGIRGNPATFISKMCMPKGIGSLMELAPAQLSGLVPYIKLFKVHYPSETSEGEEYELKFQSHLTNKSLEVMSTSRQGRGSGCGIKSFEWDLAGGNPAEAEKLIEAKMTLVFQDVGDLVQTQNASNVQGTKSMKLGFIDLIHQQNKFGAARQEGCSPAATDPNDRTYNDKYFRIKAQVGWALPPAWFTGTDKLTNTKLSAEQQQVLNQTGYTFFLTMVKHELDFKEDGTVELNVTYMAAVEGALSDQASDILLMGSNEKLKQLQETKKSQKDSVSDANRAEKCGDISKEDADKRRKAAKKAQEGEDNWWPFSDTVGLDEKIRRQKAIMYKAFLTELDESGGIYFVDVPATAIGEWKDNWFASDEQESANEVAERRVGARASYADRWNSWGKSIKNAGTGNMGAAIHGANDMADDNPDKEEAREDVSNKAHAGVAYGGIKFSLNPLALITPKKSETVRMNYIYFGAILETALKTVCDNGGKLSEIRTIVGPITFTDPRTGVTNKVINLADVPISLNLFQVWFFDKCIAPQREKWLLKDFIQNAIETLVGPAMTPKCFGDPVSPMIGRPRLNMKVMTVPLADDGTCRISAGKVKTVKQFNQQGLLEMRTGPKDWPKGDNAAGLKSGNYFFLYATAWSASALGPPGGDTSREDRDRKMGIYHFRIGSDRGLVKKIKFKREDSPHMGAARIAADGPGLLAMRELYNADIDMFGNALWIPGSMIYIDTADSGLGSASANIECAGYSSISQALGLGGYYMVISAKSSIESGKYETTLETKWQSSGTGRGGNHNRGGQCADGSDPDNGGPSGGTPPPVGGS